MSTQGVPFEQLSPAHQARIQKVDREGVHTCSPEAIYVGHCNRCEDAGEEYYRVWELTDELLAANIAAAEARRVVAALDACNTDTEVPF